MILGDRRNPVNREFFCYDVGVSHWPLPVPRINILCWFPPNNFLIQNLASQAS